MPRMIAEAYQIPYRETGARISSGFFRLVVQSGASNTLGSQDPFVQRIFLKCNLTSWLFQIQRR
jgi:hypothetical protein